MQVLHQICAGMDVHKKEVKVCLVTRDSQGQRQEDVRSFRTMTHGCSPETDAFPVC
jgi:transposase